MSTPFVGEIRLVGFNFAPTGWLLCNGQILSIADYDVLYDLIGTTYGGDGQNTFAAPNLQSRVPVHSGSSGGSTYVLGQSGGVENVTVSTGQLPSHTHAFYGSAGSPTASGPGGGYPATGGPQSFTADAANLVPLASNAIASAGGSGPHTNLMPYQCISFIIATQGIYPSQN